MNNSEGTIRPDFPKVIGDFPGHSIAGTFFFIIGFWWSIKSILKHICKKQKQTCYLGLKALLCRAEILEGILLICMTSIGATGMQIFAEKPEITIYKEGQRIRIMRFHHLTLYFSFGLLGVVNILCFTISSLPVSLTKLMLSSTYFMEAFVFYNHTHGREMLDLFVHHLLDLAAILTALVAFSEILTRNNVLLELLRSSLVLLQGTWLWQIGFVLYPTGGPAWDLTDHNNKLFLTVCFCWHYIMGHILIGVNYAVVTWLVKWRLRKLCPSEFKLLKSAEQEQESEEEM